VFNVFKALVFTFGMVAFLGACRTVPAQAGTAVPLDPATGAISQVRALLDGQAFDASERKAVSAVASAVQQAGGSPSEQYVVGPVEHLASTLRIQVVHARDLAPECRNVRGDCSGWQRVYELNAETGQVVKVMHVQ